MSDAIDGPAKLHAGHVMDRGISHVAGSPRAYRNRYESNLAMYAEHGHLDGGRHDRAQRLEAGDHYRALWERVCASGHDSTQLDVVRGGGGTMTQAKANAIRALFMIDRKMPANDLRIVRHVCAEGHSPAEGVRLIDPAYCDKTAARFREALDSLIFAISVARA